MATNLGTGHPRRPYVRVARYRQRNVGDVTVREIRKRTVALCRGAARSNLSPKLRSLAHPQWIPLIRGAGGAYETGAETRSAPATTAELLQQVARPCAEALTGTIDDLASR